MPFTSLQKRMYRYILFVHRFLENYTFHQGMPQENYGLAVNDKLIVIQPRPFFKKKIKKGTRLSALFVIILSLY